MQILVATLRGAVHQQQRAAAYAALLPSLVYRSNAELATDPERSGPGYPRFFADPDPVFFEEVDPDRIRI